MLEFHNRWCSKKKQLDALEWLQTQVMNIQDLEQEAETLSQIWCEIQAIKRNEPGVRDEMVLKMYGSD